MFYLATSLTSLLSEVEIIEVFPREVHATSQLYFSKNCFCCEHRRTTEGIEGDIAPIQARYGDDLNCRSSEGDILAYFLYFNFTFFVVSHLRPHII